MQNNKIGLLWNIAKWFSKDFKQIQITLTGKFVNVSGFKF